MENRQNSYGDSENKFGKTSRICLRTGVREGKTILEDVYFTAPYKIMTPFEKANGGIQVMPLCASAGIMRGDRQEFDYQVGKGVDLEILSQSFEKIHKMEGGFAERKIRIHADTDSSLCYYPQPVIPFGGSIFQSDMEIRLADESSRLFLLEIITCGRNAHEERFAYRRFSSKVRIYRENHLIYRDNTRYEPEKMPMERIGMYEGYSHMANIFLSVSAKSTEQQEKIWEILEKETECEGGVTCLSQGDLAVKIFGNRAQILQETAEEIKRVHFGLF